jgi:6-phosphofructokinase 1
MPAKRIGILTSGGDAPGMNAALRAATRYAIQADQRVFAIYGGFQGLVDGELEEFSNRSVGDILTRGGTIIGTRRSPDFQTDQGFQSALKNIHRWELDCIIAIGGDGTFRGAMELIANGHEIVGIPATIDNDVHGTEFCIGFDTAVNTALECLRRLRDTAGAHKRTLIMEVMGRESGWIALYAGIAGGAEAILLPEFAADYDAICDELDRGISRGKKHSIIVVAEGVAKVHHNRDDIASGYLVAQEIEKRLGFKPTVVVLGHVQRGGSPTAQDAILATRMGIAAVDHILKDEYGIMVAVKGGLLTTEPLDEVAKGHNKLDEELYKANMELIG